MSDFDKEAEREKLREKYGDDEANRETTEQMSELLLKGATMTNAHCNNCGDPIFRYDGQEFCPTCQQPVDRGEAADGDQAADEENIEVTTPSDEATVQFGGQTADSTSEQDETADAGASTPEEPTASTGAQPSPLTNERPTDTASQQPRTAPSVDPSPSTANDATEGSTDDSAGVAESASASAHLANAQTLLAQTVEQYAQRARDADSPRQARESLEAAREAAKTLDETGF